MRLSFRAAIYQIKKDDNVGLPSSARWRRVRHSLERGRLVDRLVPSGCDSGWYHPWSKCLLCNRRRSHRTDQQRRRAMGLAWRSCRPEGDESWEQTLRREVLEEACAAVIDARLLGFCRAVCLTGPEQGLVLVRSIWLAEVELMPWEPRFEIEHRRVVPAAELLAHLWMEEGFEPIYHRALVEARLV